MKSEKVTENEDEIGWIALQHLRLPVEQADYRLPDPRHIAGAFIIGALFGAGITFSIINHIF